MNALQFKNGIKTVKVMKNQLKEQLETSKKQINKLANRKGMEVPILDEIKTLESKRIMLDKEMITFTNMFPKRLSEAEEQLIDYIINDVLDSMEETEDFEYEIKMEMKMKGFPQSELNKEEKMKEKSSKTSSNKVVPNKKDQVKQETKDRLAGIDNLLGLCNTNKSQTLNGNRDQNEEVDESIQTEEEILLGEPGDTNDDKTIVGDQKLGSTTTTEAIINMKNDCMQRRSRQINKNHRRRFTPEADGKEEKKAQSYNEEEEEEEVIIRLLSKLNNKMTFNSILLKFITFYVPLP